MTLSAVVATAANGCGWAHCARFLKRRGTRPLPLMAWVLKRVEGPDHARGSGCRSLALGARNRTLAEGAAQQAAIWRHLVAGGVLSRPGRPWPTAKGPTSWADQQPMRPSPTSV